MSNYEPPDNRIEFGNGPPGIRIKTEFGNEDMLNPKLYYDQDTGILWTWYPDIKMYERGPSKLNLHSDIIEPLSPAHLKFVPDVILTKMYSDENTDKLKVKDSNTESDMNRTSGSLCLYQSSSKGENTDKLKVKNHNSKL